MRGSFTLGRIAGIDIKVHVTFFLLLAWIGFVYYRSGGMPAAIDGVLFVLLIFLLVVLHEFGHALAARRYGIETQGHHFIADWRPRAAGADAGQTA